MNSTIAGPTGLFLAMVRIRVVAATMSVMRERRSLDMVGMPSIQAGHTNQFTDDASFWSPDVSEHSASCGAWKHASYGAWKHATYGA